MAPRFNENGGKNFPPFSGMEQKKRIKLNCSNTSDLVPLYLPQQLYLKPIARLNISLQLPSVKKMGKSISHWEIMEKLRELANPEEFTALKVTKTTIEFVRFEAEVDAKAKIKHVLGKLDNRMIKLKDFSDLMRIRAAEWKSDFPNRRVWDDFFQNNKEMDESRPGERPDTIHFSNLPTKWFLQHHLASQEDVAPSEKIFYRVFEKFGTIRYVDIPICDPYRKKMKDHISGIKYSSFDKTDFFEGYLQFKDYLGFTKTMDAFRDMKLVHKDDDGTVEANIKVEFDKSKHLSDASIRRREIVRDRLVKKAREKEEKEKADFEEKKRKENLEKQREVEVKLHKEQRRRLREEKRKAKILEKLQISGADEINVKIAKEEKKLLKVQRKLEAIRLIEELFRRVKEKQVNNDDLHLANNEELKRFKSASELEVLTQRQKLHYAVKGRVMLKSILSEGKKKRYSSSESSLSLDEPEQNVRSQSPVTKKYPELVYDPVWFGFPYHLPTAPMYPEYTEFPPVRGIFPRGRASFPRASIMPGSSRGAFSRRRGGYYPRFRGNRGYKTPHYPPGMEEQYHQYFSKFLNEHDDRYSDNRRKTRSPSYSPSRHSRSRKRSYTRSYTRSRSRKRSRSRSRSRSKRSYSKSRSKRKSHSRDRSNSTPRRRSRTRSRSSKKSSKRDKRTKSKSRSKSREKSVDSSTFMTPQQLQQRRAERRSRSKSLPTEGEKSKVRSWSQSPEK